MAYGFSVTADENVVSVMKKVETAINSMAAKVDAGTRSATASLERMESTAGKVAERLAELFAVRELLHYGQELLHLTAEFEGYQNIIRYASKNSYDAAQNLEYIGSAVSRLHLPLKEATESFAEMQAGFFGTGIEGEHLRKVFEGISTASSVLHLTPYQFGNVTFALKEIGELGTLQARQMRMLAFALPGAMHIAAQSMKMNSAQFHEAMHQQAIKSSVFLPAFAEALKEHYSPGLGNAGNSLISQMNDTKSSFIRMALEIGENLRPVFTKIMQDMRAIFDSSLVKGFITNIKPLVETMLKLGELWVFYKVGVIGAKIAMEGYAVVLSVIETLQALSIVQMTTMEALMTSMANIPLSTIFGGVAIAIGLIVNEIISFNQEVDDAIEKFGHLQELKGGQTEQQSRFGRISNLFNNQGAHTPEEKSEALSEIIALTGDVKKHLGVTMDQQKASTDSLAKLRGPEPTTFFATKSGTGFEESIEQQKKMAQQDKDMLKNLETMRKIFEKSGIKPVSGVIHSEAGAVKEGSLSTMGLAGAKGGLGEAKTVVIHIGTLQRNEVGTPDGLKLAGENAIEVMVRALNNIAYGQSKTM